MEVGPTGAQFGSDPSDTGYAARFDGREIVRRQIQSHSEYLVIWARDGEYAYYDSRVMPKCPGLGPRDVLRDIVDMKLRAVARRIEETHRAPTAFAPALLDALADRCTDPETGARNVDHVLRGSLLPALSGKLLERMAAGARPGHVAVGLAPDGGWKIDVGEA